MDHLAKDLGMDPIELRMKNFLKDGDNLVSSFCDVEPYILTSAFSIL